MMVRIVGTLAAIVVAHFAIDAAVAGNESLAWALIGGVNVLGYAERLVERWDS